MYESNAQVVFTKLRKNIQSIGRIGSVSDAPTRAALISVLAFMRKRIFEEGLNANGNGFGIYSNEYLQKVRKANNNSSSKINLELTGEMRREYILDNDGKNWVIGFLRDNGEASYSYKREFTGKRKSKNNPGARKGVIRVTTTAPVSGDRAELLEKRYGIIFNMSKTEIGQLETAFNYEAKRRLNG